MVSVRRRPGVFLLAIATMMFSLVLLSATSSGAQTESPDQNNSAEAAVGDEECVEFENGDSSLGTDEAAEPDTSEPGGSASPDVASEDAADDNATDPGAQGVQDQSEDDLQAQQDGGGTSDPLQTQQDGDEGDQRASQNENEDGTGDLQDLQEGDTTSQEDEIESEDGAASPDDVTGSDGTTSLQDEEAGEDECVVADTVPDESLLPTGAPAGSRIDEKTAKKNNSGTQEKTTSGEARPKPSSTRKQKKTATAEAREKKTAGGEAQQRSSVVGKQRETTGGDARQKSGASETRKKNSGDTQKTTGGEPKSKPNRGEAQNRSASGETQRQPDSGGTVVVRDRGLKVDDRSGKEPRQEDLMTRARSAAAKDLAPRLAATEWTRPSLEEIAVTNGPRNFAPNPNAGMTLSASNLGLYDMPVMSSDRRQDLDNGLVHVPETSRPWDEGGQKNVFIAGHYLGVPQTASRLAFYNLHKLEEGDELVLEDGQGQAYKYRVNEKFAVGPEDSWAMGEVRGRDMVTLQTCIPPDFGKRLMVRADRVPA